MVWYPLWMHQLRQMKHCQRSWDRGLHTPSSTPRTRHGTDLWQGRPCGVLGRHRDTDGLQLPRMQLLPYIVRDGAFGSRILSLQNPDSRRRKTTVIAVIRRTARPFWHDRPLLAPKPLRIYGCASPEPQQAGCITCACQSDSRRRCVAASGRLVR